VAITDFGNTALIGNARLVDSIGNPIPGASFTRASGYDYITPPSPITFGDIDQDGDVDRTDAALFTPHLGTIGAEWASGDFNGDRFTTLDDLHLLQLHLGQSLAPSPANVAVPEPPVWLLAVVGAFIAVLAPKLRLGIEASLGQIFLDFAGDGAHNAADA